MARILTPGRLRGAAVAVTALIPASLIYALAHADTSSRARTAITVSVAGERVSGTVRSPRESCEVRRTVLLMTRSGSHVRVVARAVTDPEGGVGAWSISRAGLDGSYYAKLPRTDHCRVAVSAPIQMRY